MLHYITGRPGSGKSEYMLRQMQSALESGGNVVFLVPEQQTVLWESRIAQTWPAGWQLRTEVTNFTRLANTVFREYGGLAKPRIDDGGRTLVLWRAMLSVWDMLSAYNRGTDGREDKNIPALSAALGELKRNGVTPDAVDRAAADLALDEGASGFAKRLADVALVYAAYEDMLHLEYSDRDDVMKALADTLEANPFFAGKSVFVDSFYSVTLPELRILRAAAGGAADLWVSFACDREDTGELPFLRIRKFLRQMERIAADCGKIPVYTELREDRRHTTDGLQKIAANLFRYDTDMGGMTENAPSPAADRGNADAAKNDEAGTVDGVSAAENSVSGTPDGVSAAENNTAADNGPPDGSSPAPDVSVYLCADRYEESEAVAALIEQKVRSGCRYRDIAVVGRRMDSLRGILDTTLQRHGIPCFVAEADPLSASPAVRLLTSLLAVEARGYDRRDLVRMIGTGLTPVTATEADCFAVYTETWNIRGRAMFWGTGAEETAPGWSWNPDGYRTDTSPWGKICLREAGRARDKLLPHVAAFSDIFRQAEIHEEPSDKGETGTGGLKSSARVASVREICRGLVTFADRIGLYPRLMEQSEEALRRGRREESAKTAQVWSVICEALDKMVLFLGDVTMDAGRFSGLFSRVIASMEIGAIPTALDEVLLGSADGIRFGQVRHVILVGAVEGEFPSDVSDAGFFRDSDRVLLEGVGVNLSGSGEEYLAEEYWMFYRTAASATETLTVTCPRTVGGESCALSPGAERILTLTGVRPIPWNTLPPEKRIFHPAARTGDRDPALRQMLESRKDGAPAYYPNLMDGSRDTADPACISAHFGSRMRLTQSRLDSFSSCPFRYWCQYGIALQEPPRSAITSPDIGSFIHAVLEQFFRQTKGRAYPLPPEETEELTDTLVREYLEKLGIGDDGRLGYLFVRLRRNVSVFLEAIMEEYSQSRFVPMAFELPVGLPKNGADDGVSVKPLSFSAGEDLQVTLSGIIDRVDSYTADDGREYVRVVDYKTGSRTFSLADVRQGIHVQLLVYLFSLTREALRDAGRSPEAPLPAGAVYFQIRPGETASESMLTPEEARQKAVDHINRSGIWLRDEEILEAMDAGLSGKYVPVSRKKDGSLTGRAELADLARFGEIYRELESTIVRIAREMADGRSEAVPKTMPGGTRACGYCPFGPVCRIR